MADPIGLGVIESGGSSSSTHPYVSQEPPSSQRRDRPGNLNAFGHATNENVQDCLLEAAGTAPTFATSTATTQSDPCVSTCDSHFSRHDSLFSFGVSSSRNAAELKSLLGNASSRLKPGAKVLSMHDNEMDKEAKRIHAVMLEQAKPRARVEVDIILESDCCVEGGYMRGSIKLRVRPRQKKEAPVLLAEGKVRVIGFESITGEADRYTFYQRASLLSAITDAYTGIYDSPPDTEGYSRAMEGVHVLPFAMHLPVDGPLGCAKGSLSLHSGELRYIAMVSVKVKDSGTGKRSIAHFYRDCQVWPCLNPVMVLASAPRPIQAATTKSISVIGNGNKIKLTAMLHRMTWIAGQRCYLRIWISNAAKKSVKSVALTLVRTITLFKPKPHLDPGNGLSVDPDACQTTTTHKVEAESVLQRSQTTAKGHASAGGWWIGVQPGHEAQFSHYVLIPSDSLSVSRSRLIEVEYSIRVTVSAGALVPDVHVTLPVRIINFLSVDPTPHAPPLLSDGTYAHLAPRVSTLIPDTRHCAGLALGSGSTSTTAPLAGEYSSFIPGSLGAPQPTRGSISRSDVFPPRTVNTINLDTPLCHTTRPISVFTACSSGNEMKHNPGDGYHDEMQQFTTGPDTSVDSDTSFPHPSPPSSPAVDSALARGLGNLDIDEDVGSDEEVDFVIGTAHINSGSFLPYAGGRLEQDGYKTVDRDTKTPSVRSRRDPSETDAYAPTSYVASDSVSLSERNPVSRRDSRCGSQRSDASSGWRQETVSLPHPGRGDHTVAGSRNDELYDRSGTKPVLEDGYLVNSRLNSTGTVRQDREGLAVHSSSRESVNGPGSGCSAEEDTPRLSTSVSCAANIVPVARSESEGNSGTVGLTDLTDWDSTLRASRRLPLPPPRSSRMCDIPASVSALEVLQMSQLCALSHVSPAAGSHPGPGSRSRLVRSAAAPRSLPASPTRSKGATSSSSSTGYPVPCSLSDKELQDLPPSTSGTMTHQRPDGALRNTGQSECSIVKGRIAAFEERLKKSRDTGAAYV